jgi:hypothetical protein
LQGYSILKEYQPVAEAPDNPFPCALDGGKYMSRKVLERRRFTRSERFPQNPRQIKKLQKQRTTDTLRAAAGEKCPTLCSRVSRPVRCAPTASSALYRCPDFRCPHASPRNLPMKNRHAAPAPWPCQADG